MKKFEITKEQINILAQQHSWSEKYLKENFPQAFETELEVGKWYKQTCWNDLIFIDKINEEEKVIYYGFDDGEFKDERESGIFYGYAKDTEKWELATDKEVETALINEAIKRGFKEGCSFNRVNSITKKCDNCIDKIKGKIYYNGSGLITGSDYIFYKGKWATISEPQIELTLEQIAEKFNVNVNNLKIKK